MGKQCRHLQRAHKELGEGRAEQTALVIAKQLLTLLPFSEFQNCSQGQSHSDQGLGACFPLSQRNNTKHDSFVQEHEHCHLVRDGLGAP